MNSLPPRPSKCSFVFGPIVAAREMVDEIRATHPVDATKEVVGTNRGVTVAVPTPKAVNVTVTATRRVQITDACIAIACDEVVSAETFELIQ